MIKKFSHASGFSKINTNVDSADGNKCSVDSDQNSPWQEDDESFFAFDETLKTVSEGQLDPEYAIKDSNIVMHNEPPNDLFEEGFDDLADSDTDSWQITEGDNPIEKETWPHFEYKNHDLELVIFSDSDDGLDYAPNKEEFKEKSARLDQKLDRSAFVVDSHSLKRARSLESLHQHPPSTDEF